MVSEPEEDSISQQIAKAEANTDDNLSNMANYESYCSELEGLNQKENSKQNGAQSAPPQTQPQTT